MPTVYTVYKTINLTNGKFYIGVHRTENINDRYLGSGIKLKSAIMHYGRNNFMKEILYVFDTQEEAFHKEKEMVTSDLINSDMCYNLAPGGIGGSGSMPWTDEAKAKVGKAHKGKIVSEETRNKMSESIKIALAKKERVPLSEETRMKLRNAANKRWDKHFGRI